MDVDFTFSTLDDFILGFASFSAIDEESKEEVIIISIGFLIFSINLVFTKEQ